ncbi:MAG: DUF2851 family protein [Sphingobacteriales bacterium]|nr:DUF2851 family protein [Sphingobacteriales bacterium]
MITEAFLQYIWRLRRFDAQNLITTNTHETVEILQTGELNKQSGPDFLMPYTYWRYRLGRKCRGTHQNIGLVKTPTSARQSLPKHYFARGIRGRCATIACRWLGFTCCGVAKSHFACFVPQLSATTIHRSLGALCQTHQEY